MPYWKMSDRGKTREPRMPGSEKRNCASTPNEADGLADASAEAMFERINWR